MGTDGPLPGNWRYSAGALRPRGLAAFGICTEHNSCNGECISQPQEQPQPQQAAAPADASMNQDSGDQNPIGENCFSPTSTDERQTSSSDSRGRRRASTAHPIRGPDWSLGESASQAWENHGDICTLGGI
eukprot:13608948-Heterocapsa_arctica.AAC.1